MAITKRQREAAATKVKKTREYLLAHPSDPREKATAHPLPFVHRGPDTRPKFVTPPLGVSGCITIEQYRRWEAEHG